MYLLDPRNGPDHDVPEPSGPQRAYVIASLPRTGSTLLGRLLGATGAVGDAKEWLNPMQIRDLERRLAPDRATRLRQAPLVGPFQALAGRGSWSEARLRSYLSRVRARRTGPSGIFGLKIHLHHYQRWLGERDPRDLLGPVTWLAITRGDEVAQAVSWYRALQTGRWTASERGWLPPIYDRRGIAALLDRIEAMEATWERTYARLGVTPHRVTYEALSSDPIATVRSALRALGVEGEVPVPSPPTAPQADAVSAEWIARFRASTPL
jgi:LPS sulfotransferase NodH